MIGPASNVRVYLACGATDMRKGIERLIGQAEKVIRQVPSSGTGRLHRRRPLPVLNRLRADIAGNTAMFFAVCLPVVLALVGGAIDFSRATQFRMELQDAADTAALGSIAINSNGYKAAGSMGEDGAIPEGVAQALAANVAVTANYKPYLLGLVGFSTIPLKVNSVSTSGLPPYINFYLLLDNTPSMGVGARTADINKMVANTSHKCAFACHQMDKAGNDYYAKAKALGVTTRIEVVRKATQNLMSTAKATETTPGQYSMAIYHFGMAADA